MKVIDIKPSRASELLKKLTEYGVIEPVSTDSGNSRDEKV